MISGDAIRFSWSLKIKLPRLVIADIAATPARLPVTRCLGVSPRGDHVFASNAVSETFASSWKYMIASYFRTARRIRGISLRTHSERSSSDSSKYSRSGFWYVSPASCNRLIIVCLDKLTCSSSSMTWISLRIVQKSVSYPNSIALDKTILRSFALSICDNFLGRPVTAFRSKPVSPPLSKRFIHL